MLTYIDNRMFRNNLKFVPACCVVEALIKEYLCAQIDQTEN